MANESLRIQFDDEADAYLHQQGAQSVDEAAC